MEESSQHPDHVEENVVSSPPSAAFAHRDAVWTGLVERMATGDQDALARLYDETSGIIHALALRILRAKEDAEEAVLDAYAKAWRLSGSFDPARGSVMTWLIMMTRSIAIDRIRSGATRAERTESLDEPHQQAPSGDLDPELHALFAQQRVRVRAALTGLPEEQRDVIELAFFGGFSHSELAEKLGVPLGTVKTRVRLGLQRLRGYLEDLA